MVSLTLVDGVVDTKAKAELEPSRTQPTTIPFQPLTYTINYQRPTCPHCHSAWITEHSHSPTQPITVRCWSCKRDLSGQLKPSTHFDDLLTNQNTTHEREKSTL